jgi:hypothetical protein
MEEQVPAKIFNMLETLALKMNTTVEHLWGVLTQQAYVESYSTMISCLLPFVLFSCILIFSLKKVKGWQQDEDWSSYNIATIFGIVGTVISFVATLANISAMLYFLNPEYYAYREFARLLG